MIDAAAGRQDFFEMFLFGGIGERLADRFGTTGAPISLTTACATGASAIQLGVEAIQRGEAKAALCIGAEGSVAPEAMIRFSLLSALSTRNDDPTGASRPFEKNRGGFVMSEGAACLVLHSLVQALWQGGAPAMPSAADLWGIAIVSGMLSTGIGNLMWNRAIGLVGMARAAVWLYWVPLFGVAAAVGLLGEPLTVWHAVALLLVFAGTYLGTQVAPVPRAVDQV
jgi:uncharacterized membrane protein